MEDGLLLDDCKTEVQPREYESIYATETQL